MAKDNGNFVVSVEENKVNESLLESDKSIDNFEDVLGKIGEFFGAVILHTYTFK